MSHPHTFEHTSVLPASLEKIWAFHEQPNAFGILTPPPIFVQVHRREMVSLRQGEIEFTLWFAFFPIRWLALHEPGSTPTSFVDRMLRGPLKTWRHEHRLEATPNGTRLTDQITIEHHGRLARRVDALDVRWTGVAHAVRLSAFANAPTHAGIGLPPP
jgi:ligand-binding SRPBCC domain-containing protein